MESIKSLVKRLKKIGIEIELFANYPWIYLDKVNGIKVTEKFEGNHGFTVAFIHHRDVNNIKFTNIKVIFNLIRRYINETKERKDGIIV